MFGLKLNKKLFLILILIISAIARICWAFYFKESWYSTDTHAYFLQANQLLQGQYPTYFPNGYPIFISIFLFLTSSISLTSLILIIINIILSTSIILITFKISLSLYNNINLALVAAILVAFYPHQINFVRFILTEIPFSFLLILSLFLLQKYKFGLSALSLGFASIMRTTFIPLGILFSFYLFFKKEFKKGSIFLVSFLIPILSLLLYGYIISGEFTLGNNAYHNLSITVDLQNKNEFVDTQTSINHYIDYFKEDPTKFILDRIYSLWNLWGPFDAETDGLRQQIIFRILGGLKFPLFILALYGFFCMSASKEKIFMGFAVLVLTVVHFFFFSNSRFSLPVVAFLAILAAKGIEQIYLKYLKSFFQNFIKDKKEISVMKENFL